MDRYTISNTLINGRIRAAFPAQADSACVQRSLRRYGPIWDAVHHGPLLDLVIEEAVLGTDGWWRPARIALLSIAAALGLGDRESAEAWLVANLPSLLGRLQDLLKVKSSTDLGGGLDLGQPLIRHAILAAGHYHEIPAERGCTTDLDEGTLACLYEFSSREPEQCRWLVKLGQLRPRTAARVLWLNYTQHDAPRITELVDELSPQAALELIGFLESLGLDDSSKLAYRVLDRIPPPQSGSQPELLALGAHRHLYRGQAAAYANLEEAPGALEDAWLSTQRLMVELAIRLGQMYQRLGHVEAAGTALSRGLDVAPSNPSLIGALAKLRNDQGQYTEALALLDSAPDHEQGADYALVLERARALVPLVPLGSEDEALQAADRASELATKPLELRLVASVCAELGKDRKAAEALLRALEAEPCHADWYGDLGELFARLGDLGAAEKSVREQVALSRPGGEYVRALQDLSAVQRKAGNFAEALDTITEAAHLAPRDSDLLSEWTTTAHSAQEWEITVRAGQAALATDPERVSVYTAMGEAYDAMGHQDEALFHLQRATQLSARSGGKTASWAWCSLAKHYERRNQLNRAEKALQDGASQVSKTDAAPLFVDLAALYERTGRLTEARQAFEKAYHSGARSTRLLTGLGLVLGKLGLYQKAVTRLQEATQQPDRDGYAFHQYALALEGLGRVAEAGKEAATAAGLLPDEYQVLHDAGRLCLDGDQVDEAAGFLEKAVERDDRQPETWSLLGQAYQRQGLWENSFEALSAAARLDPTNLDTQREIGTVATRLGRHETAIAVLKDIADRAPKDAALQVALAESFEAAGWWDQAQVVRRGVVELVPDELDAILHWARAARMAGSEEQAEEAVTLAEGMAPHHPGVLFERGMVLKALGDTDSAAKVLGRQMQVSTDPATLWQVGDAMAQMGETELAIVAFGRSADLQPENPGAQERLGQALAGLGRPEQALAAFRAAARLEPDRPDLKVAIGDVLWELEEHDEAAQVWKIAHHELPESIPLMERVARAHSQNGDPSAALAMYERAAAEISRSNVETSTSLAELSQLWREAGRAALALDEQGKAKKFLERGLEAHPDDPETHSLLGALADRAGRSQDALNAYRRAAELAPSGMERVYQLQLADALTDRGEDVAALRVWEGMMTDDAEDLDLGEMLRQMGKLYARAGRYPEAERSLRSALDKSPDNTAVQCELASVVVEKTEMIEYQIAAGIDGEVDHGALLEAATWLANGDAPQQRRDLARSHLLLGQTNEGIAGLNSYLANSAATNDLRAQRALGVAYRQAGSVEGSIQTLTTALRLNPQDARTAVELARSYMDAGVPDLAVALLDRIADKPPTGAVLLYHLAQSLQDTGQADTAIERLKAAVKAEPAVSMWNRVLSQWIRRRGVASEALPYAEAAVRLSEAESRAASSAELGRVLVDLGREGEAIEHLRAACSAVETDVNWWIELAKLLNKAGSHEDAADVYLQALKLMQASGGDEGEMVPARSSALTGLAQAQMESGRLEDAETTIQRALALAPKMPAAQAGQGLLYELQGLWQDALTAYQMALLLASEDASMEPTRQAGYHLDVARAYRALGAVEQALEELERAASLGGTGQVHSEIGEIQAELGSKDLARQAFQQAAQASPNDPRFVLRLARFLQKEGQLDQALDWLLRATEQRPNAELWLEIASVYNRQGQRGMQMEALFRADHSEPRNPLVKFELGMAHKQRKEYRQAIRAFESAVELEPTNRDAHKQLAAVLAMSFLSAAD